MMILVKNRKFMHFIPFEEEEQVVGLENHEICMQTENPLLHVSFFFSTAMLCMQESNV
jgi:hypothetical protein